MGCRVTDLAKVKGFQEAKRGGTHELEGSQSPSNRQDMLPSSGFLREISPVEAAELWSLMRASNRNAYIFLVGVLFWLCLEKLVCTGSMCR